MNNGKKKSLHIMYISRILDMIICNTHIVNCMWLLDYDKIVLYYQLFVLYCIILTNFIFIST